MAYVNLTRCHVIVNYMPSTCHASYMLSIFLHLMLGVVVLQNQQLVALIDLFQTRNNEMAGAETCYTLFLTLFISSNSLSKIMYM